MRWMKDILLFLLVLLTSALITYGISISFRKFHSQKENVRRQPAEDSISVAAETKFKNLVKKSILQHEEVIYDKQVLNTISIIYKRLIENIEDVPYHIDIVVIKSSTVNAVTFPGGLIVIYSGLIEICETPEQLAAVIAHELAHVVKRDSLKKLFQELGISAAVSLFTGGSTGSIDEMISVIVQSHFSRETERKADVFAAELLMKSNLSPKHLADFFNVLSHNQQKAEKAGLFKYLSSHPDTHERIATVTKYAASFNKAEEPLDLEWKLAKEALPSPFDSAK